MSRPPTTPEWSSDVNYPAGSDPWSATATKIEPTSGEKAQGAEPSVGFGAQQFNWILNEHAGWLNHLDAINLGAECHLNDDFNGTTFTNNWTVSGTGTVATVDDSAAGAFGAAKLSNGGGGVVSLVGPIAAFGTVDFRFDVKLRVVTASTGNSLIGISGGSKSLRLTWDNTVDGNWYYVLDGAAAVSTGVAFSSSYQTLSFRRIGGSVYLYIGATLVYSGAYASNLTGSAATIYVAAAATTDVRVDYAKLWANRA